MAKLSVFMLCDAINNIPGPGNESVQQLVSPQIALRPQFVPGNYSFGVAVGIQDINLNTTNKIRFTIADPHGTLIQDSGPSEFPTAALSDPMPQENQGFVLSMDFRNLPVAENGEYILSVFVNDELVGQKVIPIFQRA